MKSYDERKKNKNDNQDIELPQSTRRSFKMLGLTSFPPFKILLPYESLTFSGNPIDSFLTLPSLPNLKRLDVSETDLNSFQYIQTQPIIESIYIRNTPLFHYSEVILMTVIAFGSSLKKINGSLIPQSIYKRGLEMKPYLFCYLYNGWIILGDDPIKIFNVNTRKRLFFVSLKSIPQIPMKKYKDDINWSSNSYSSFSALSTHKKKVNNSQTENNNENKIKKVSKASADRISQSMPRIPAFHTSKASKKTASKSGKNESFIKNKSNKSQCCNKTSQPAHKRNKSMDFRLSKSTNVKPLIRSSKSHDTKAQNSNIDNSKNDKCTFQKATPVCIRRKRHSCINNLSSNEILLDNDDDILMDNGKTQDVNNNAELLHVGNSMQGFKENKAVFEQNVKYSNQSIKEKANSLILEELNDAQKGKSMVNIKMKQILNEKFDSKNEKESNKLIKKTLNCGSENIDEEQNAYLDSASMLEVDNIDQQLSDKSNEDTLELSESSSTMDEPLDELSKDNTKNCRNLLTKKLDHSNALHNLSSIKNIYQDLIFSISTSEISETNEYISDTQINQQIEKNERLILSDSTMTDDFSSSISYF